MKQGDLAALSGVDREVDRFVEVLQARGVPEVESGETPEAEGARGTRKAELFGERERTVGGPDRVLGLRLEGIDAGHLGERGDERG